MHVHFFKFGSGSPYPGNAIEDFINNNNDIEEEEDDLYTQPDMYIDSSRDKNDTKENKMDEYDDDNMNVRINDTFEQHEDEYADSDDDETNNQSNENVPDLDNNEDVSVNERFFLNGSNYDEHKGEEEDDDENERFVLRRQSSIGSNRLSKVDWEAPDIVSKSSDDSGDDWSDGGSDESHDESYVERYDEIYEDNYSDTYYFEPTVRIILKSIGANQQVNCVVVYKPYNQMTNYLFSTVLENRKNERNCGNYNHHGLEKNDHDNEQDSKYDGLYNQTFYARDPNFSFPLNLGLRQSSTSVIHENSENSPIEAVVYSNETQFIFGSSEMTSGVGDGKYNQNNVNKNTLA